jgi:hypothetical protein
MPNRLLTNAEVNRQITAPYCRAVAKHIRANPSTATQAFQNPFGRDMLPLVIQAKSEAEALEIADRLDSLADNIQSRALGDI